MSSLPLAGRRVLVTRAAHQAGKLSEGLRALGAEAVEVPVLEIQPPASFDPLDAALRQLDRYDWMILTSANAVRALEERAAVLRLRLEAGASMRVAVIGEATAAAARKAGLAVALIPERYVAESLVSSLSDAAAEAFSRHEGDLNLGGLTSLTDVAASILAKMKGEISYKPAAEWASKFRR